MSKNQMLDDFLKDLEAAVKVSGARTALLKRLKDVHTRKSDEERVKTLKPSEVKALKSRVEKRIQVMKGNRAKLKTARRTDKS
jgi:hypothetical protein